MREKLAVFVTLLTLTAAPLFPQGLETTATKDDWEEINFLFDRAVLTDGYPSLLKLAELLKENPEHRVKLEGHADSRGSEQYNVGLSEKRARTVSDFLTKYGAPASRISVVGRGKTAPKVSNDTDAGRWINRRVEVTVTDAQGNVISSGGIGDAIESLNELARQQEECCNKILRKLDDVLDMLKALRDDNEELKQEVADLKNNQRGMRDDVDKIAAAPPPPPAPPAPPARTARSSDRPESGGSPGNEYSSINFNVGPDVPGGNVAFSGKGRYFRPFAKRHALQAEGEFFHQFGRDEGQVDFGLVNRFGNVQAGIFSSFKFVKFDEFERTGSLGQAAFTLDYVFKRGRVGFFGTKKILDGAVVNEALISRHVLEQTYLRVVDQAGVSTAVGVWGDSWIEGNFGAMFRSGGGNRPGGTLRYIHPVNDRIALTFEAGLNQTLVSSDNTGRVVVGVEFGKWLSPQRYELEDGGAVPVDIPRVRYEVLKRRIRSGNDAPVADAGPDLIGIDAGPVTLDASASFDPDEDEITFAWDQIGGPPISLTGAESQQASFTAEEGENYQFRLTVRDTRGAADTDRVTVSTLDRQIKIVRFSATPVEIRSGETVNVVWEVQNADQVEISGIGSVDPNNGTSSLTLDETTTLTLTARNPKREVSQSVTVRVLTPQPRILRFSASPMTAKPGESVTLIWETAEADRVTIDGLGSVEPNGTATVSVDDTTTYTLTAANDHGEVNSSTTVTVREETEALQILRFFANPAQTTRGGQSALIWEVVGAEEVEISGIGSVGATGSSTVTVDETTTYTLTARSASNEIVATAVVTVVDRSPAEILEFTAEPAIAKEPGDPVVLRWNTANATKVSIVGIGDVSESGSIQVNPVVRTTYTLVAYGINSEVTAEVTVTVENANRAPTAKINNRGLVNVPDTGNSTIVLDGTQSRDPDGDPLTFQWRSLGPGRAEIMNPTSATPSVRLLDGTGTYNFELEVTDDKGLRDFDSKKIEAADLPDLR